VNTQTDGVETCAHAHTVTIYSGRLGELQGRVGF